jgi:hypothetical protein
MTANHTADGINSTSITTPMNSYMASLNDQPDLGFLAFLKVALRENDDVSEELTDWLVESWWGLMSEVQESNAPAKTKPLSGSPEKPTPLLMGSAKRYWQNSCICALTSKARSLIFSRSRP